jgi:hypothetical protein
MPIYDAGLDVDILKFDMARYGFREWFSKECGTSDLELLHVRECVTPETYGRKFSDWRKKTDNALNILAEGLADFVSGEVEPIYGKVAGFQASPTVRFHFSVSSPNLMDEDEVFRSQGPGKFLERFYWTRPALFHRDKDYGLPVGSMNLWIPVTAAVGTGALWIGGRDDRGRDAQPADVYPGQAICFDGAGRWHGAVWNTSGLTRLSFDIRVAFAQGAWRPGRFPSEPARQAIHSH